MKCLVRNGKYGLMWKDLNYNVQTREFVDTKTGEVTYKSNIFHIQKDVRKRYVVCKECGQIFKSAKAFKHHVEEASGSIDCLGCKYVGIGSAKARSVKIKRMEDGTISRTTRETVGLYCCKFYRNIEQEDAPTWCYKRRCANATSNKFEDFFTKYPNAFAEFPTVDRIIEIGYKERSHVWGDWTAYLLKGRRSIKANVDGNGLVISFDVSYRQSSDTIYYSKKYDMFFVIDSYRRCWSTWSPDYRMSTEFVDDVKKKIREIYK